MALRGAVLQAAGWVRLRLGWFAAAAGLAGLAWIARGRLRARPRSTGGSSPVALPGFYRRLLDRLSRSGLARDEAETPAELASRAAAVLPAAQAARVRQLTELPYKVFYSCQKLFTEYILNSAGK